MVFPHSVTAGSPLPRGALPRSCLKSARTWPILFAAGAARMFVRAPRAVYNASEAPEPMKGTAMRRNALILTFVVAAALSAAAAADTVFLKNGTAVSGKITKIADDKVHIKTRRGVKSYTRDEVTHFRMPKPGPDGKPLLGPNGKPIMANMMFKPEPLKMPFSIETDHYVIKTDISKQAAENIAKAMEHLYKAYVKVFRPANGQAARKADVIIFDKQTDFLAYAKRIDVKPRKDTLGFYRARSTDGGEIVTYKRKGGDTDTLRTLYHEATHQFMTMLTGVKNRPPLWVNEGLAVYFESSQWRGGKLQTGLIPKARLAQLQKAVRARTYIHLPDLVNRRTDTFNALCYAESWSLVYFFVKAGNGRYAARFTKYFRALKAGAKHDAAFKEHLTGDFGKLERLWKRFVLNLNATNGN